MPATPGTQIGPDGRRVAIAELPTESAEAVALDRRRAVQAATLGELVAVKPVATTRDVVAPGTAAEDFDALEVDEHLSVEVEADSSYAVEVLAGFDAQGVGQLYLAAPDGATATLANVSEGYWGTLYAADDPDREPFKADATPLALVVGLLTTVDAGTVAVRWAGIDGSATDATLLAGALLRLTKA